MPGYLIPDVGLRADPADARPVHRAELAAGRLQVVQVAEVRPAAEGEC